MKKTILLSSLFLLLNVSLLAQDVVISETESPADSSAILDVQSKKKGVLFPRMTSSERDAIEKPAAGLIIFNTSRKCIEFYTGNEWSSSAPAGTIKPFGGPLGSIPDGWLLCDGLPQSTSTYSDLYEAIGGAWGTDNNGNFNLPDLRGQFLRGVSGSSSIDPDKLGRSALKKGGNNGNKVGSYQSYSTALPTGVGNDFITSNTGNHWHYQFHGTTRDGSNINRDFNTTAATDLSGTARDYNIFDDSQKREANAFPGQTKGDHRHIIESGGNDESRPVNAYVNYIIKY